MADRDIDKILAEFAVSYPEVKTSQLQVKHPADDDGLWFFRLNDVEVQVESGDGNCPFLIEGDAADERVDGVDQVSEVLRVVSLWLGLEARSPRNF